MALRERHADPFLISPLFTGSNLLGYVQTKSLERADRRFRLSSAMAISAAAISPNMGKYTNKLLVWVLSLMNFRLGYWIPNVKYLGVDVVQTSQVVETELLKYFKLRREAIGWQIDDESRICGFAFPGGGIRAATYALAFAKHSQTRNYSISLTISQLYPVEDTWELQ